MLLLKYLLFLYLSINTIVATEAKHDSEPISEESEGTNLETLKNDKKVTQSTQLDDLIDSNVDDELDDSVDEEAEEIKCAVNATRPYGVSPVFKITGLHQKFNALLIGYNTHSDERRTNKSSLYGWSSAKIPDSKGNATFRLDLDYVSILPQSGIPLSYCALIFVPPVEPKFDIKRVFGKPALSRERFIGSEEHLIKALRRKSRKVTSCCFVAYPMVSKR